jgi:hypothetical protein
MKHNLKLNRDFSALRFFKVDAVWAKTKCENRLGADTIQHES